jgi:hypothetical protein
MGKPARPSTGSHWFATPLRGRDTNQWEHPKTRRLVRPPTTGAGSTNSHPAKTATHQPTSTTRRHHEHPTDHYNGCHAKDHPRPSTPTPTRTTRHNRRMLALARRTKRQLRHCPIHHHLPIPNRSTQSGIRTTRRANPTRPTRPPHLRPKALLQPRPPRTAHTVPTLQAPPPQNKRALSTKPSTPLAHHTHRKTPMPTLRQRTTPPQES